MLALNTTQSIKQSLNQSIYINLFDYKSSYYLTKEYCINISLTLTKTETTSVFFIFASPKTCMLKAHIRRGGSATAGMDAALNPQKQSRGITIHTDLISLVDRF